MRVLFDELKDLVNEIDALESIVGLLDWDQEVNMPVGGIEGRSRQLAIQARLAHEKLIAPAIKHLLTALKPYQDTLPYDSHESSLIRVTRYLYDKASHIPPDFQARLYEHLGKSQTVWLKAYAENDFASVRPFLEKTLDLSREYSSFFNGCEHIADPLIDLNDPGMTVSTIRHLFKEMRDQLTPIIKDIARVQIPPCSSLTKFSPELAQLSFGREVIEKIGFDFERGRQDKSTHPFTVQISPGDVRITTRVNEYDFWNAFSSTVHEAGHALYVQGIAPTWNGTFVAHVASEGINESQSRLWENIIGRSKNFWHYFFPRLQLYFPETFANISLDTFYRGINRVQPSSIRTEADEVTYNLHVIMRFDLEIQLLEGSLSVGDLPEAWRQRFQEDFGICLSSDREGVLQDPHWYDGFIGGQFQCYILGNILSAQFYESALSTYPEIEDEIRRGYFGTLRAWLKNNIHFHGRKYSPQELINRVTGKAMTIEPYMQYLKTKYYDLYNL